MDGKPIRVLIVEDEVLEAFLLSNCLKLEGFQVCNLAASGGDAVRITHQEHPDIIVMDIGLVGEMSGIETACQIRKFSPAPILFLTGFLSTKMEAQINHLSPATHLTKPARVTEVLNTMRQLLGWTAGAS